MKLELARAMLYNADLLLLDEVCDLIIAWPSTLLISYFHPKTSLPIMYVICISGSAALF